MIRDQAVEVPFDLGMARDLGVARDLDVARGKPEAISRSSNVRWQRAGSWQADEQSKAMVSPAAERRARSRMRQSWVGPSISVR